MGELFVILTKPVVEERIQIRRHSVDDRFGVYVDGKFITSFQHSGAACAYKQILDEQYAEGKE